MAVQHIVTCRVCKEKFNADPEQEGVEWVMPSRNWYYHKVCYTEWLSAVDTDTDMSDDEWAKYIYDYLKHDVHLDYNYHLIEAQRKAMLKDHENKMTSKGIYFALRYFYDIQHGDKEKSRGGIGIVPYVYKDAAQYWIGREKRNRGIIQQIMMQMKNNLGNPDNRVVVKRVEKEVEVKTDWDAVEDMDFEEDE